MCKRYVLHKIFSRYRFTEENIYFSFKITKYVYPTSPRHTYLVKEPKETEDKRIFTIPILS